VVVVCGGFHLRKVEIRVRISRTNTGVPKTEPVRSFDPSSAILGESMFVAVCVVLILLSFQLPDAGPDLFQLVLRNLNVLDTLISYT
jgi:hypothetical protein